MHSQIIYEAEVHRHHVRLKIPIQAEVDGVRYHVDDWSVGGFAVESAMTSRQPDERFSVRLIFPFEEFEMSMRLDVRVVYVDHEHGRFGCAFLGLSKEQVAVFRHLVEAYLSGEVVSAGDLLQIKSGLGADHRRSPLEVLDGTDDEEPPAATVRRYGAIAASASVALILLVLVALGLKERFFTVTAETAQVDAPLREVRAPDDGYFLALVQSGAAVKTGEMLGTLRMRDGSILALESPCDCVVLELFDDGGEVLRAGDPLLALIDAGEPMMIRAQLPLDQVERLEVGDRAEITMHGRPEPLAGEIVRIDLRPRLERLRRSATDLEVSERRAQVLVRPDRQLTVEDFGALVRLRFF
jgi:alginate biosynthesis protein Alg44